MRPHPEALRIVWLLSLLAPACVTPISFDTGRALEKGETRFQAGLTGGGGDPVIRSPSPASDPTEPVFPDEEMPAETDDSRDYPGTEAYGAYALGARHGFGGGLELQGAAEMWTPAGVGCSLALKLQVIGDTRSTFAAALKIRGGAAAAGGGGGEDAAGIVVGLGEVSAPMSLHPTGGPGAFYAVPRGGVLVYHHTHPDGDTTDQALGVGLTLGILLDLDRVWIPIEVTAIHVPPQSGLDEAATQLAVSFGLLIGGGGDDEDEALKAPWE